jgi:hypothetical protein
MQGEHVAVPDEQLPPIEVATVWLAGHAAPEPAEVALDDGTPFLQASRGQADGESAMEPPGPPLRAGELGDQWASASAPVAAVTTSNAARRSDPFSSSRIVASSATTSDRGVSVTASMVPRCDRNLNGRRPLQQRYGSPLSEIRASPC